MIRRETWILLAVLAILLGVAYVLNTPELRTKIPFLNPTAAAATPAPEDSFVFPGTSSAVLSILISDVSGTTSLERGPGGVWVIKAPINAIADQGMAEAAATQIATLRIQGRLDPGTAPSAVGLDKPVYTLTVNLKDLGQQTVKIGGKTVTGTGYYVQTVEGKIVILDSASVEALANLLTNPPYAETPTPSPIPPTETPTSAPVTPAMELTATGTP